MDEVKKRKAGNPRKFTSAKKLQKLVDEYFRIREEESQPLTVVGLCAFLKIHIDTFSVYLNGEYEKEGDTNKISEVLKIAKTKISAFVLESAMKGDYNASVCIFNLKANHEMVEAARSEYDAKQAALLPPPIFVLSPKKINESDEAKQEYVETDK